MPPLPHIEKLDFNHAPSASVRQALDDKRRWFERAVTDGCDALEINRAHSDLTDRIVSSLLDSADGYGEIADRVAILALGGYGRREMGLFCDVDLLFLHDSVPENKMRKIAEGILYPFWDNGVEIGGATRTIDDCSSIITSDARALTAMIDARLIAGNHVLHDSLTYLLSRYFASSRKRDEFIKAKLDERRNRLQSFGDSIYIVQPNIKEGEGGLRDFHTLGWISRAAFFDEVPSGSLRKTITSERARYEIETSLGFLWRLRHALHIVEGKRNDRLLEGIQDEVAERMGMMSTNGLSSSERLMSSYYKHAGTIHLQCTRAVEKIRRTIKPAGRAKKWFLRKHFADEIYRTEYGTLAVGRETFLEDELIGLRIFDIAKKYSLPLDVETKDLIAHVKGIDDSIRSGNGAGAIWRNMFSGFRYLDRTLLEMKECNYLVHWFPEMSPMLDLVQHDGFHVYTTGVHSILAVGEIARLMNRKSAGGQPVPAAAMDLVERPHVLALATFFHDIGKGRGGGHSDIGAELVTNIAERLGFNSLDVEDVAFLVRSHLLMAAIAFKRDICDPGLLDRFARSMRSPEVLAMLYLLTFADIRAIGPNVWNAWKGSLLAELYGRTYSTLTGGETTIQTRQNEAIKRKTQIRKQSGGRFSKEDVDSHLLALPERYLFSMSEETIAAHISMFRGLESIPVATISRVVPDMGCSELSVVTHDKPGLFAGIAGILTAGGANIVGAELYTTKDGIAVDVFWLTDSDHRPFDDAERWERIRREMNMVISGKDDVDRIVAGRFKRRILCRPSRSRPAKVTVDNDVSAIETVVEVHADDRRGLLYSLAHTFHGMKLVIDMAKISTHVDRVIDVFYIRDEKGEKIFSKEMLEEIRSKLLNALEE